MAAGEWIVDGNNVMGTRPDGWWRDRRAAMRRLVGELETFAARDGRPVTVLFDGAPFEAGGGARVAVRFASRKGRDAADDDIVALVGRHPEPATLTVVTSDRGLAARVAPAGATIEGARTFLARLGG